MEDLENLLLEAAGRTSHDQNNRGTKRKLSDSDSDDRSDSKYDEGDDSDDAGINNRKHSGSKMPLKKRFESGDKEDDERSRGDDDYDSDFSVGSDLYKDDEDRERLAKMSELQREYILAERAEKRESKEMRKKGRYQNENRNRLKEDVGPPSSRMRSSVKANKSVKENALNELLQKRRKAQDSDSQRNRRDSASFSKGRERDSSPGVKSPRSRDSPSQNGGDTSASDEDRRSDDDRDEGYGSEADKDADKASFEQVREITIRRSKLEKWFMEPYFEKIIVGCFVRIGIGSRGGRNIYRLCMVKNVDATDPNKQYKFGNRMTYKFLNCFWGTESNAARWQMDRVSDSPPTEQEFKELEAVVEKNKHECRKVTVQEVEQKKAAIKELNTFVYSPETVKQMLREKKQAAQRPSNIAAEKDKLRKELELAESRFEYAEAERIKSKLKELEVLSLQNKNKNEKALMLAEMNRRNRAENFKNASQSRPANTNLKAGEAGYDPFSRRWTRSQNYYASRPSNAVEENNHNVAKEHEAPTANESESGNALQVAEDEGKLVNTDAPMSQEERIYALHNFDVPISLDDLQCNGGPQGASRAFMERRQRLEAAYGVQMPSNDGRRHRHTLTVDDYKRRRGLL